MWVHRINRAQVIYDTRFPVDVVHVAATWAFFRFVAKPLVEKIDSIKVKYGLVEQFLFVGGISK